MPLVRRFAWVLAGVLPAGLLGVGAVEAQFTDSASIGAVTLSAGTVPPATLTCTTAGTWPRTATFSWANQGAGYTYALRILSNGTLIETRNMGTATSWVVPVFSGSGTYGVRLVVSGPQGVWTSPPSTAPTGFSQPYILDTTCVNA